MASENRDDRPLLSVVVTCMGRLHHLKESAPPLLAQPAIEYILVDYSCPDRCGAYARQHWPRARVVEVTGQRYFNKCHALNAGIRAATGRWLAVLDADNVAAANFVEVVLGLAAENVLLVYPYVSGGVGFLVCDAAAMALSGGYDERFRGWGDEDDDMRRRLLQLGLKLRLVPPSLFRIIAHGAEERVRHYAVKDIEASRLANIARLAHRLEPEGRSPWPDPVTFLLAGQGLALVWRSVQYALHVWRNQRTAARLYPCWHGRPDIDFSLMPLADRSPLVGEILDLLGATDQIEVVTGPVPLHGLHWPDQHLLWHFPYAPTRLRWGGFRAGRRRRIACQLTGHWEQGIYHSLADERERLQTGTSDWEVVELDEQLPLAECVRQVAASDLFVGSDAGLAQICYAVGVPVFLLTYEKTSADRVPLYGGRAVILCRDVADFLARVRTFLGRDVP